LFPALRTIVRRDDGRTYREMLTQMAKESGIDTPSADEASAYLVEDQLALGRGGWTTTRIGRPSGDI
jgi:hypothetical protein